MEKFKTVEEQKAFKNGVDYTKSYIAFCFKNFTYNFQERRISKDIAFQRDMLGFVSGTVYFIPNKANVTFIDFCENYEKYRLQI